MSLLHLDDTQSGCDRDYDEFNNSAAVSDTENTNIVESMDTSDGNATDVPIILQNFTEIGGPTKDTAEDAQAVYYFEQYFCAYTGTTLWDMLVTETNKYYTRYVMIYYETK